MERQEQLLDKVAYTRQQQQQMQKSDGDGQAVEKSDKSRLLCY